MNAYPTFRTALDKLVQSIFLKIRAEIALGLYPTAPRGMAVAA